MGTRIQLYTDKYDFKSYELNFTSFTFRTFSVPSADMDYVFFSPQFHKLLSKII